MAKTAIQASDHVRLIDPSGLSAIIRMMERDAMIVRIATMIFLIVFFMIV